MTSGRQSQVLLRSIMAQRQAQPKPRAHVGKAITLTDLLAALRTNHPGMNQGMGASRELADIGTPRLRRRARRTARQRREAIRHSQMIQPGGQGPTLS